jgi:hypothetical protein
MRPLRPRICLDEDVVVVVEDPDDVEYTLQYLCFPKPERDLQHLQPHPGAAFANIKMEQPAFLAGSKHSSADLNLPRFLPYSLPSHDIFGLDKENAALDEDTVDSGVVLEADDVVYTLQYLCFPKPAMDLQHLQPHPGAAFANMKMEQPAFFAGSKHSSADLNLPRFLPYSLPSHDIFGLVIEYC